MFGALARAVVRRPWLVIAGWLLAAAAVLALTPGLSGVTNPDQAAFLPAGAESARAAALARQAFPAVGGPGAVVVVQRRDAAPLRDADIQATTALAQGLRVGPPTVAPNRTVALVVVPAADVVPLRVQVDNLLGGTELSAATTGEAAIAVDNRRAFADAERIVTYATLGLIVVLLLLIFRSPVAALLPLLTVGLVYAVSTRLVALGATLAHVEVGQELPTMLTVVLFGIGTDYVLFLLFRYRERRRAGDPPREAIVAAVERVGEAIASAAFAVIAAFGALVLAVLGFFTTLGPALAIGVAVMLLAALTLVPAVVAVLGRVTFWPVRPRAGRHAPHQRGFHRLGRLVAGRPGLVVAGAVALLGALGAGVVTFHPDYDPIGQLPPGTEAAVAYERLQRGFPAGAVQPTVVYVTGERVLTAGEVQAYAARLRVDGVAGVLAPQLSADGRTAAVPIVLGSPPYSSEGLDLVSGPVRRAAHEAAPDGERVLVGGPSMAFADVRAATNRDLAVIFPVAGALFVLILAGLLRAALAPVYLVAMVVAGFAATLGATAWAFDGRLAFSIPIILYLFVTAIGTDYNILVTARLREEMREGRPPREAAALAVAHAGPSVAAAALILGGTFAALLISGVPFFVEIGVAVTLGILLVALVVSILLVPAVTALAGRAAWWPGRRRPDRAAVTVEPAMVRTGGQTR